MGKAGKREYVQVPRLVETFDLEVLHGAVKDALRLGAIALRRRQTPCAVPYRATPAQTRRVSPTPGAAAEPIAYSRVPFTCSWAPLCPPTDLDW